MCDLKKTKTKKVKLLTYKLTLGTSTLFLKQEKCHQYWPAERSARYQYFVVDPMAEYNMPQYILREFKVTDARVRHTWVFQCVQELVARCKQATN